MSTTNIKRRKQPCFLPHYFLSILIIVRKTTSFPQQHRLTAARVLVPPPTTTANRTPPPSPRRRRIQNHVLHKEVLPWSFSLLSSNHNYNDQGSDDKQDPKNLYDHHHHRHHHQQRVPDLNFLQKDGDNVDSERRPRRLSRSSMNPTHNQHSSSSPWSRSMTLEDRLLEWGVEKIPDASQQPKCPDSMESVAQGAFHAISSTLYGKNFLDPNIASNAMALSITDRRPVGFAYWPKGRDVGRLGIEIDGLRHLLASQDHPLSPFGKGQKLESGRSDSSSRHEKGVQPDHVSHLQESLATQKWLSRSTMKDIKNHHQHQQQQQQSSSSVVTLEGRALRLFSLVLASKLSRLPWDGLEEDPNVTDNPKTKKTSVTRPVALFFNTLRQALQASHELQLLQKISKLKGQEGMYDNIRILCLGQDDIPKDMLSHGRRTQTDVSGTATGSTSASGKSSRRKWGASKELTDGTVNPMDGMILIVQPTDWNNESSPPYPSVGILQNLQKLLARATIAKLPAVVISPRLTEQMDGRGIEQSGYQKSSTYGGIEPPKGPTPWILRDFIPPVFSWIGSSIEFAKRPPPISFLDEGGTELDNSSEVDCDRHDNNLSYLSRVAMTQSVMESGHPWHIYAVENVYSTSPATTMAAMGKRKDYRNYVETNYHYMASTIPKAGRPSRQIILDILSDWTSD